MELKYAHQRAGPSFNYLTINYIELADDTDMIVREVNKTNNVTDVDELVTVEHLEDIDTRIDLSMTANQPNTRLLSGNQKELKQGVAKLLVTFIDIMNTQKDTVDVSYEEIQDRVFKLRETEKNSVTDILKKMTDEERNTDTIMKINKLGKYSIGMQKGLTTLDKEFYDKEQDFRDEMSQAEKLIRRNNSDANDANIDMLIDDQLMQDRDEQDMDDEANDMSYLNDDYFDGNTDGVGAPEEEYDDYQEYN